MTALARLGTLATEIGWLFVIVLALPLAVLAIGIPAALVIRLVLGLFQMA